MEVTGRRRLAQSALSNFDGWQELEKYDGMVTTGTVELLGPFPVIKGRNVSELQPSGRHIQAEVSQQRISRR